jgi:acetylornithine/N-succinyldiaminopimelate aminotransferase
MNELMDMDKKNIAGTYARYERVIDHGSGPVCVDTEGRELIDFTAGIGVNSLGFCDPDWVSAVSGQTAKLQHVSNLYYSRPQIELAAMLTARTAMSRVFFGNSGAEANECAIKTARKYGNSRSGNTRNKIITISDSFHGRTMATITATAQEEFHQDFFPFVDGFAYCPAGDIVALEKLADDKTCAVMVELIQGEGGVIVQDIDYIKALAELCRERDILLIVDEVQTGVGRTGTLFAYEQYGIEPDLVTFAKGMGGGLPIGGVLFNKKTAAVLKPGDHGTTFGGNPVVCAGAIAVLNRLTPDFLAAVAAKGRYIMERLTEMDGIENVDGRGLMIGFQVKGREPGQVVSDCLEQGLMLLTAHAKVRMLPPLIIDQKNIDRGLEILEKTVSGKAVKCPGSRLEP